MTATNAKAGLDHAPESFDDIGFWQDPPNINEPPQPAPPESKPLARPPPALDLPPILDAADWLTRPIDLPTELVYGLLHRGSKLVLGGGSKTLSLIHI